MLLTTAAKHGLNGASLEIAARDAFLAVEHQDGVAQSLQAAAIAFKRYVDETGPDRVVKHMDVCFYARGITGAGVSEVAELATEAQLVALFSSP